MKIRVELSPENFAELTARAIRDQAVTVTRVNGYAQGKLEVDLEVLDYHDGGPVSLQELGAWFEVMGVFLPAPDNRSDYQVITDNLTQLTASCTRQIERFKPEWRACPGDLRRIQAVEAVLASLNSLDEHRKLIEVAAAQGY